MRFNKSENKEYYTFISAFEADADKPFSGAKVEKDGQSCTVTVELDGKAPGLPTGDTLNPSSARTLHTRRPVKDDNITPNSKVKGEDIDFEFLRKAKHPDTETGARVKLDNRNVSIEKKPLFLGRRGAGAEPFNRTETTHIREYFPGIVKENQPDINTDFTASMEKASLRALNYQSHRAAVVAGAYARLQALVR
ncbi:MAG: hypothetical protein ACI4OS_01865 [Akkermansia sp.]